MLIDQPILCPSCWRQLRREYIPLWRDLTRARCAAYCHHLRVMAFVTLDHGDPVEVRIVAPVSPAEASAYFYALEVRPLRPVPNFGHVTGERRVNES